MSRSSGRASPTCCRSAASRCRCSIRPGHTLGHVSYWIPEQAGVAFVGDTLFAMGCEARSRGHAADDVGLAPRRSRALPARDASLLRARIHGVERQVRRSRSSRATPSSRRAACEAEAARAAGQATLPTRVDRRARDKRVSAHRQCALSASASACLHAAGLEGLRRPSRAQEPLRKPSDSRHMDADRRIIAELACSCLHPEGGHYRETFRDAATVQRPRAFDRDLFPAQGRRGLALAPRRRRRDLALACRRAASCSPPRTSGGAKSTLRLGPAVLDGERPQGVVEKEHWQQAWSLGAWTLVGCTVAPGFSSQASSWRRRALSPPADAPCTNGRPDT